MFQLPRSRISGVTGVYGALIVTFTRLPSVLGHLPLTSATDVSAMSTHANVGSDRFGMSRFWVAIVATVSALLPIPDPGWTLVTRAISRAASATPFIW